MSRAARGAVYPAEGWAVRETSLDPAHLRRNETIFAVGNGYLGIRGTLEEGWPDEVRGTYLNGFYDEAPIVYGEIAHAYARNRQVMLNVADATGLALRLGPEILRLTEGTLLAWERRLDLRAGLLERRLRWRSPGGVEISLSSRRLACLERPHVAALEWTLVVAGAPRPLRIEATLEGETSNQSSTDDPRIGARFPHRPLETTGLEAKRHAVLLEQRTRNTGFALACAVIHEVDDSALGPGAVVESTTRGERVVTCIEAPRPTAAPIRLVKYIAYATSLDREPGEPAARARSEAAAARGAGFERLAEEQAERLGRFWAVSDVRVGGDESLQQSLRYNLYSLLAAAGRDGRTSVAAKGLTGQGYEGHYFWDTEIYVLPFFAYTHPEMARALVRYRCGTLDAARERAREMSQRGALFPWRTIGGRETSAYYPAGTAQYHIDADIAYALRLYVEATGDRSILSEGGAELLFETARLWADLGWTAPDGSYRIDEVTGPDEYTALVNNNTYTNLMARENLRYAARVARELERAKPETYNAVAGAIRLEPGEVDAWEKRAAAMRVPYDAARGIHAQDDAFLDREPWDLAGTPPESFPLLLHYHPLVIYRKQVLKQPDVVLAQTLLGDQVSRADKKRNFDYYDPLTTGDSSLSPCVQCVAAAELGYTDKAYEYFRRTARMDLDDVNGNVGDGVHTAAMAGTWISVVRGFAGMRQYGERISFAPRLPRSWSSLELRLRVRGRLLEVSLTRDTATYRLLEGEALEIEHLVRPLRVPPGGTVSTPLRPVLEGVIFDLDGVLTDTAELHYQAWKRLADELGLPFDTSVNEHLRGVGRLESLQLIYRSAGVAAPAGEMERLAERKNEYYRALLDTLTPRSLLPGVEDLLRALRAGNIRVGVASASRNAPTVISRLGIGGHLDYVVDAGSLGRNKPDPEIFFAAAEALRLDCRNCAGVEDARAGVRAIKAAGMYAVGVGTDLPEADWVVRDTGALTLERLLERFEIWSRDTWV